MIPASGRAGTSSRAASATRTTAGEERRGGQSASLSSGAESAESEYDEELTRLLEAAQEGSSSAGDEEGGGEGGGERGEEERGGQSASLSSDAESDDDAEELTRLLEAEAVAIEERGGAPAAQSWDTESEGANSYDSESQSTSDEDSDSESETASEAVLRAHLAALRLWKRTTTRAALARLVALLDRLVATWAEHAVERSCVYTGLAANGSHQVGDLDVGRAVLATLSADGHAITEVEETSEANVLAATVDDYTVVVAPTEAGILCINAKMKLVDATMIYNSASTNVFAVIDGRRTGQLAQELRPHKPAADQSYAVLVAAVAAQAKWHAVDGGAIFAIYSLELATKTFHRRVAVVPAGGSLAVSTAYPSALSSVSFTIDAEKCAADQFGVRTSVGQRADVVAGLHALLHYRFNVSCVHLFTIACHSMSYLVSHPSISSPSRFIC